MSNPFEAAIHVLRGELYCEPGNDDWGESDDEWEKWKDANGGDAWQKLMLAAIRVLEAARKAEFYYAMCVLDEPGMPEKGTESWKDWVRGREQIRAFIDALPDKEGK
jgi:hypothetical protein